MQDRVMMEFYGGKILNPFCWVVGTEYVEIGFQFLIGSFSLCYVFFSYHSSASLVTPL